MSFGYTYAAKAFDPYRPGSGTEHVALPLYSHMRMSMPAWVIDFGSGYTTLFKLTALAGRSLRPLVPGDQ